MNKIAIIYVILRLMMDQLLMVQSYREHKVHNIVLYPDKHSWCKTTTIKQVISYPGCTSAEIDNNVCVGACFSYSIPQTEPSDPGEVIVPYCDSCQPSETTWHQITLQCNKNDADTPSQLIKHVQIIQNCSCTPCEKDSLRMRKNSENNEDLSLQTNVDSEILNALHTRNESNVNSNYVADDEHWKKMHSLLNQEIVNLLKNIEVNNTEQDKEKLFELFSIMQEPLKHKVRTKNIIDFIEKLPSNMTDLNTSLLADILMKFEKNHKSKIYDEIHEDSSENDKKPLDLGIPAWMHNAFTSKSDQIDGNLSNDDDDAADLRSINSHHLHEHHKHKEKIDEMTIPDIAGHSDEKTNVDEIQPPQQLQQQQQPQQHHHTQHTHNHQHHHVNDNIASHGHLTRGPHGALVIEPDRKHEKLVDVNEHELKPNHAGTLLSYHSPSSESNPPK